MNFFALLLLAASCAYGLSRWLKLPSLPVLIASGMALNLSGLLPAEIGLGAAGTGGDDHANAAMRILEFGLLFLVFASGVELAPRRFSKHTGTVGWVAGIQFSVSALIGIATSRWIVGLPWLESCYLGFGLAASSTLVVLRQLRVRQAMFEPFGRVVTGVLLLQDVALIAVIVVFSRVAGENTPSGLGNISLGLGETVLLGAAAWVAQRHIIPALIRRMKPDEESLLLWLVATLFCFLGIAHMLRLPPIAGAFAGGFVFSAFPLSGLVRGQISSLTDFFIALFFVALGALVGVPDAAHWWSAVQFSLIVIVFTPPLVTAIAEWRGMNTRASIESGLLLAQTSEFSLLLGLSGLAIGHVSVAGFEILALTTIITMTLTPFIGRENVARFLLPFHPLRRKTHAPGSPEGHILVLGFGQAGMWTVKPLRKTGEHILVVDDDAIVCRELARMGVDSIRGDAGDEPILERAGAAKAKLIICSMRRVSDAIKVLQSLKDVPVLVRVFEEDEARAVEKAGGIPIDTSAASAGTLMEWMEANGHVTPAAGETASG
jgi:CPA2 family monovalent cation:H+ antiporter-2